MGIMQQLPVTLFTGSDNVHAIMTTDNYSKGTKWLGAKYHFCAPRSAVGNRSTGSHFKLGECRRCLDETTWKRTLRTNAPKDDIEKCRLTTENQLESTKLTKKGKPTKVRIFTMQSRKKKKIGEAENDLLSTLTSFSTMRDLYKEYGELRDGLKPELTAQNEKA